METPINLHFKKKIKAVVVLVVPEMLARLNIGEGYLSKRKNLKCLLDVKIEAMRSPASAIVYADVGSVFHVHF